MYNILLIQFFYLFVNLMFVIIFIVLKSNPLNTLAYAKKLKAVGFTDEQVYPVKCFFTI